MRGGRVRRNATRGERCVGVGRGRGGRGDVPISRISQYITCGPQQRLAGLYLALLLPPATDPEAGVHGPTPAIVHTVLIGIHCRPSDLFRRLPGECRRPMPRYLGVLVHYRCLTWPSLSLLSSHGGEGDGRPSANCEKPQLPDTSKANTSKEISLRAIKKRFLTDSWIQSNGKLLFHRIPFVFGVATNGYNWTFVTIRFDDTMIIEIRNKNRDYVPRMHQQPCVPFSFERENAYRAGKKTPVPKKPSAIVHFPHLDPAAESARKGKRRIVPLCKLISLPVNAPIFQTGTWLVRPRLASVSWQQEGEKRGGRGREK